MRMCTCEHVRVHVHVHLCARVMRFRLGIIAMRIWVQARVVGHALGGHGSLASTTALAVDAVRSAGGDATAGGAAAATGVVASRFFGAIRPCSASTRSESPARLNAGSSGRTLAKKSTLAQVAKKTISFFRRCALQKATSCGNFCSGSSSW